MMMMMADDEQDDNEEDDNSKDYKLQTEQIPLMKPQLGVAAGERKGGEYSIKGVLIMMQRYL